MSRRLHSTIAAASLLLLNAACGGGDGTVGPGGSGTLDVAGINATAAEVQSILNQPILNSLTAQGSGSLLGDLRVGGGFARALPAGAGQTLASALGQSSRALRAVVAPLRVLSRISPEAPRLAKTIPDSLLGGTFVRNGLGDYVRDPMRAGAPANGVRIIIYSGLAPSAQELGYADVTDLGNPSTDRITVDVVAGGVTVLQYDEQVVTLTQAVTITGFVANGTRQITFRLVDDVVTAGPQADEREVLTLSFAIPSANASVNAVFVAAGLQASDDALAITLTTGSNQLTAKAGTVLDKVTGEYVQSDTTRFTVNGSLFALGVTPASGLGASKYLRPDGTPLSASDASILDSMLASYIRLVGIFAFVFLVDLWLFSFALV